MRRVLLFAFLTLIPAFLLGQKTITGIVLDSLTQKPLPLATVYINGTTQGTTTDHDGRFELKVSSYPATVVFSFVGYRPQALDLTRNPGELKIMLSTSFELPEVVVSGKADEVDKKELDYFKSMFLGDDRWGKNATIRNEKALMINASYQPINYIRRIKFSSFAKQFGSTDIVDTSIEFDDTVKVRKSVFTAWAYEPLIIDLPLLGYVLYVDLVKFSVVQVNNVISCNILGYFYYKPYEKLKKRQAERIEENRRKAYYGSSQHFLKSLAQDRLAENGYIFTIPEQIVKRKRTISMYKPVDIKKYMGSLGDSLMQIHDLKDNELKIKYYHRGNGTPVNFKEKGPGIHLYSESGMTLLKDTCTFLKEGIIIDNNIRFTGNISKKRVASCLPNDYIPPTDTSIISVRDSTDYTSKLIKFADNIHQFNTLFPQEKVYLEFDNTAYFQGENIWYKAFVTNATTLERAPSGVLYVDFLSPEGKLIQQRKLKIVAGQADGVIPLLDVGTQQTREKRGIPAYPSGFYEIRAYTQNMLDFSPEAIFSRVIPVYTQPKYVGEYNRSHVVTDQDNPLIENLRGESKEQKNQKNRFDIAFYPEGGDLIYNLPCRIAFKITGNYRFDEDEELITPGIRDNEYAIHDGMGSFIITPSGSEAVQFKRSGNVYRVFNLPKPVSSGYSMISDMCSDSLLEVNIWRTPDRVGEQTALAVMCRGEVIYFEEIKDIENSQLSIDCSGWPAGVCRMTLFNKDGMILSSRSIFHGGGKLSSPTIAVNTDSLSHQSCDKEVIELKLTDQDGNPLRDRFCLSVRDAADYGNGRTDNLQTNLLLSSDLRGYIHDPAWYLEKDDEEHREALNLLTLVQGWERYEWQTMTGLKEFEERHRVEEGLTMNGWILSYRKREPVSDIGIFAALTPDKDKSLFESFNYQTDSTGYFGFDMSDFYGNGKLTIHLMSKKKNGLNKFEESKRIRFERADRPAPRPYFMQETDLSQNTPQVDDYKVDFTNEGLTAEQLKKLGIVIDGVDIEEENTKIRFIDYDTFTSFETEEDAELELDKGEYTTDLIGYFLERGIRFFDEKEDEDDDNSMDSETNAGGFMEGNTGGFMKGNTGVFMEGNAGETPGEKSGEGEGENGKGKGNGKGSSKTKDIKPYFYVHNLDDYIGSIIYGIDIIDVKSIIIYDNPMYPRDFKGLIPLDVDYRNKINDSNWFTWLETCMDRFQLIDIQIKEDNERLLDWEIRNLGRRVTTVKGFTKPVQFYAPEYPDGPIEGEIDPRRTLYWNPNVVTDNEGHARVEFYNNSFTRRFTIRAAGITASGVPYILNQNW